VVSIVLSTRKPNGNYDYGGIAVALMMMAPVGVLGALCLGLYFWGCSVLYSIGKRISTRLFL
jgi:hypothetical protein